MSETKVKGYYNLYHKGDPHEMEFHFKKTKKGKWLVLQAPLSLPKYIQGKNLNEVHIAVRTYLSSRGYEHKNQAKYRCRMDDVMVVSQETIDDASS